MRGIGTLAMVLGGGLMAVGTLLMLAGVFGAQTAAEQARAIGEGRALLLTGGALALAGVLVRGVAHILAELQGLRADAARRAQPVADAPFFDRGPVPPKPEWNAPPLPPRIDMVARHGEQVGGAAWDVMRRTRKAGEMATEAEALRLARLDLGLH